MDADFSHDPADVPRLIAATADAGADLALGSRYVDGGGIGDWGPAGRRSRAGGAPTPRTWLGLGLRDLTGGFKCFRREVLESIRLETVSALGYAFQIETTYRAVQAGFRVAEIPIVFSDRRVGRVEDEPRDRRRSRMESAVDAISRQSLALRPFRCFIFCSKVGEQQWPPVRLIRSI